MLVTPTTTRVLPKGTDAKIVEKFSTAVGKIINNIADYQKEIAALFQAPTYMNTADTVAHWTKELEEMMAISDLLKGK
jgi:tripartite-type tricarboxylate transporter receptor subunit TctC